jgi:hypothetical protein
MRMLAAHEKNHDTKLERDMNGAESKHALLYCSVKSSQKVVNDILERFTLNTKSHPISSPSAIYLLQK